MIYLPQPLLTKEGGLCPNYPYRCSPALSRPIDLDEEDRLPFTQEKFSIRHRNRLGGVHEERHEMHATVGSPIDRILIMKIGRRWNASFQKNLHILLQPIAFFRNPYGCGRVIAEKI